MLIDGKLLDCGNTINADYCVIGTGMGGSAVALKLAEAGRDVLLVEAGGVKEASNGSGAIHAEHVGRSFRIPRSRSIELGGTSAWWHGVCGRLDDVDFEARPWIPESGWPISAADIGPFYEEASTLLGSEDGVSLDPEEMVPELRERLGDFPFNRAVLRNKVVCVPEPPRCWKNTLLDLARQNKLRCLINSPALELVTREDGQTVDHLVAGIDKGTLKIHAKTFVVCAGALETPRLLLNSHDRQSKGLGNAHDIVGRFLTDHPMGHFCKLRFRRRTDAPLYASVWSRKHTRFMVGLTVQRSRQQQHEVPNHALYIRPSVTSSRINDELLLSFLAVRGVTDLSARQFLAILTNRDLLYRILVHRFGFHPTFRFGDLVFLTEQLPNRSSRVGLSQRIRDRHSYPVAEIDWQLQEADLSGFEDYAKVLFESGLKSDLYERARIDPPSLWRESLSSSAHHLGTARMADSPSRGVVDRNLKVFDATNVYICDGSVLPTAGNVNPSLTIVALGRRLGKHLLSVSS